MATSVIKVDAVEFGTITEGIATVDQRLSSLQKCGHVVNINCRFHTPSTSNDSVALFSVPVGYRPVYNMVVTAIVIWGTAVGPMTLAADGNAYWSGKKLSTNTDYSMTLSYLTND